MADNDGTDLLSAALDDDDDDTLELNLGSLSPPQPRRSGEAKIVAERDQLQAIAAPPPAPATLRVERAVNLDMLRDDDGEELWRRVQEKIQLAERGGGAGAASDNIVVVVRVRPFNAREKALNTTNCIEIHAEDPNNNQVWIHDPAATGANAEPTTFRCVCTT